MKNILKLLSIFLLIFSIYFLSNQKTFALSTKFGQFDYDALSFVTYLDKHDTKSAYEMLQSPSLDYKKFDEYFSGNFWRAKNFTKISDSRFRFDMIVEYYDVDKEAKGLPYISYKIYRVGFTNKDKFKLTDFVIYPIKSIQFGKILNMKNQIAYINFDGKNYKVIFSDGKKRKVLYSLLATKGGEASVAGLTELNFSSSGRYLIAKEYDYEWISFTAFDLQLNKKTDALLGIPVWDNSVSEKLLYSCDAHGYEYSKKISLPGLISTDLTEAEFDSKCN